MTTTVTTVTTTNTTTATAMTTTMTPRALIDITPAITPDIAVWPGDTPVSREVLCTIEGGATITLSTLRATVHLGAHADQTPDGVRVQSAAAPRRRAGRIRQSPSQKRPGAGLQTYRARGLRSGAARPLARVGQTTA